MANTFAPGSTVAVLLEATRGTTRTASTPVVVADAGVENVNAQVDALIATGALRRLLAFTELTFSNSMIEACWRSTETSAAVPPSARERRDHPPVGGVLRPRTQPRASTFSVSRTDARRDVFRHRGGGAGGIEVTGDGCAASARPGQPVRALRGVPVSHRRSVIPSAERRGRSRTRPPRIAPGEPTALVA